MSVADRIESLRGLGAELWRDGRGPILVAVSAGWFLSLGVRMIYPAILPQLRGAYGLDLTTAGLLITALWIAYALGQLPGGLLDDRLGGGRVLVVSTVVATLALTIVIGAGGSVGVLFGATILFGFATALYGVARFTILSSNYPEHGGTAIGLTMAAGDLGNSILPPVAGALAVAVAWQAGLGFTIPLFVVAVIALYLFVPSDGRNTESSKSLGLGETLRSLASALRYRPVLLVIGIQTLSYSIWQAVTAFYPTYLIEAKGIAPTTATLFFGGFFALGILVKPLAGSAYDAYGLRRSLPTILLAMTVSMVLLPIVDSFVAIIAVAALSSSVLGYGTITLTYLTESFPEEVQGTGLGALRTGYMLIGAASPTVVGVLADAGYFDQAFFLLGAVGAVALALSLAVPER